MCDLLSNDYVGIAAYNEKCLHYNNKKPQTLKVTNTLCLAFQSHRNQKTSVAIFIRKFARRHQKKRHKMTSNLGPGESVLLVSSAQGQDMGLASVWCKYPGDTSVLLVMALASSVGTPQASSGNSTCWSPFPLDSLEKVILYWGEKMILSLWKQTIPFHAIGSLGQRC